MKAKRVFQVLFCISAVVLAASFTACGTDDTEASTEITAENMESTESTESASTSEAYSEGTQIIIEDDDSAQDAIYYHAAICGAVITQQDGSPRYTYVKKCESCGAVQSGTNVKYASGGTLHGYFQCTSCLETQQYAIETTKY